MSQRARVYAPPSSADLPKDWGWDRIKYALASRDITLADIARECGVSKVAVTLTRDRPSKRVESVIASMLGVPPWKVWPSRYSMAGTPLRRRRS